MLRINHKRLAAYSTAITVAALLVAGCGSSGNSTAKGDSSGITNGTVTLTLLRVESNIPYSYQIRAFEKRHPNIHINVEQVPFGQFYAKTAVLASSSNPPDIYDVDAPTLANLAAAGVLLPLNGIISNSYFSTLTSAARKELSYDGKYYSPGPIDTALALFYNKTLLAKAGITPPSSTSNAWTWPQAKKAMLSCEAHNGGTPKVWGLAPSSFGNGTPGFDYYSNLFLRSEGSPSAPAGSSARKTFEAISPNGKTVQGYLNSPLAIAGATFYQTLFTQKVTPATGNPNMFIDGGACFEMNTSNYIDALHQAKVPFQFGVTPWPYLKTPIVQTGSIEIAISAKTKHRQAAAEFVKFVSSPSQQALMVAKEGYLPVIQSLYSSIPTLKKYPWTVFTDELAQWGQPRPVTPHYLQYSNLVTTAMRNIAYGSSPSAQLNSAAQQLDQLLQQPAGSL